MKPPAAAAEGIPPGSKLVGTVFNDVYQIKIATDANAPKAAYGSCFVVEPHGILATNFHVVAYALHEPTKYHLYLLDGEQNLPAEVIAFDAVNDLALVRVDRTFGKAVRFAQTLPDNGDKIYSIGWPEDLNKAVSEGNFNGLMTAGPYRKIQMSIPLNPGMSGGPTINDGGEVIGVNVSLRVDSQSLAFAVPKEALQKLIKRAPKSYSRAEDKIGFEEEMRAQIESVQEELSANLVKKGGDTSIGGWTVLKPEKMVKCWHSQENGSRDQTMLIMEHCYLSGSTPIKRDLDTGTFRLRYRVIENRSLNSLQFVTAINDLLDDLDFGIADKVEKFTTKVRCRQLDLVNQHQIPMRVHYCVNSYIPYSEAYNFEFELVSESRQQNALLIAGSFLGFSSHNFMSILRAIVNSIHREGP